MKQDPQKYAPEFHAASVEAAKQLACTLDIAYGDHERHQLDVFSPESVGAAPAILFFHGGYWRRGDKCDRRFLARKWRARGVAVALANYRLAPDATLLDMIDDARAAFSFLVDNAQEYSIDPKRIVVAGNSAGAHLASFAVTGVNEGRAKGLCLQSGLFDLRPLLHTSMASVLGLDAEIAAAASPIFAGQAGAPTAVFVGAEETDGFKAQSESFHQLRRAAGLNSVYAELEGRNHFSIIRDVSDPESPIGCAIADLLNRGEG